MKLISDEPLARSAVAYLNQLEIDFSVAHSETEKVIDHRSANAILYGGREPFDPSFYHERGLLSVVALLNRNEGQIDVARATRAGILVLEPHRGESASVADFASYLILKSARFRTEGAIELDGKTLGLIGFTPTATALAQRAKSFGMNVLVWDEEAPQGRRLVYDCEFSSLVDLLVKSDFVVNLRHLDESSKESFGKDEIQLLKKDATLIHLADPSILRIEEVIRALDWEYLANFYIDLPAGHDQLYNEFSPYLGDKVSLNIASDTFEAREAIHLEMVTDVLRALEGNMVDTALNQPRVRQNVLKIAKPWMELAYILGRMMGTRLGRKPRQVEIVYGPELQAMKAVLVQRFLCGLAHATGYIQINDVSAEIWSQEQSVQLRFKTATAESGLLCSTVHTIGDMVVGGMVRHDKIYITQLDGYYLMTEPTTHLLLVPHANRPGMVGQVGTLLGDEQVNIRGMVLGQKNKERDSALMWMMLDSQPTGCVIDRLSKLPGVIRPEYINITEK